VGGSADPRHSSARANFQTGSARPSKTEMSPSGNNTMGHRGVTGHRFEIDSTSPERRTRASKDLRKRQFIAVLR
jgi:hypothetical protein